jgi:hypothetical protein
MGIQLQIPLFSDSTMAKVKEGHLWNEMQKLREEVSHLKHQRAGHIGAYKKLKFKNK